jgi:hypothetical protein
MNKKYLQGGTIPIPEKETMDNIDRIRSHVKYRMGFAPSRSETISMLVKFYMDENPNTYDEPAPPTKPKNEKED